MKRIVKTTVAIAASFLAGYGTSSYLQKNLALSVGIATGGALFGGGVTWLYLDTKLNRQRNELQARIENNKKKLEVAKNIENQLTKDKSDLQLKIDSTTSKINQIIAEALTTEDRLKIVSQDNSTVRSELNQSKAEIEKLKQQLENVKVQRDEFIEKTNFKEAELVSFEKEFSNKVKEETDKNIKSEVERETARQFELLEESEKILVDMDTLMNEIYHRHQSQRHYTLGLTDKFTNFKDESDTKNQRAYEDLLSVNHTLENQ